MEPICWWLKHNHDVNAYVFYDDLIVTGLDKDKLAQVGKELVAMLKDIGFDINAAKCDLEPQKKLDWLGVDVVAHATHKGKGLI